jgi:acyl-CoA thioesterase-1
MQAPGNYGPDYKQAFDTIYPDLAEQFDVLYAESFFDGLASGGDPNAVSQYMQPDGIHPNAQGVARIVEALGPSVLELVKKSGEQG